MVDKFVERLREYLDENDLELTDIPLPDDKESCDVLMDTNYLAEFYIKYFNEFSKAFRKCQIDGVRQLVNNKEVFLNLLKLSSFKSNKVIFETLARKKLEKYVLDNYTHISWFYGLIRDISVNKEESDDFNKMIEELGGEDDKK